MNIVGTQNISLPAIAILVHISLVTRVIHGENCHYYC